MGIKMNRKLVNSEKLMDPSETKISLKTKINRKLVRGLK